HDDISRPGAVAGRKWFRRGNVAAIQARGQGRFANANKVLSVPQGKIVRAGLGKSIPNELAPGETLVKGKIKWDFCRGPSSGAPDENGWWLCTKDQVYHVNPSDAIMKTIMWQCPS